MPVDLAAPDASILASRGVAYALLARLLSSDTTALADGELLGGLRDALARSGDERVRQRLAGVEAATEDPVVLRRHWIRWFDQGRVAPYECSNTPASAGGITPRLADIAGFYRAFGFQVSGERPDHVVAELEFASAVAMAEAVARATGEGERAEVCARAARAFLRDHLGRWLTAWAARVGDVDALAPWAPFAAAAAELVTADATTRNVIPVRSDAVLAPAAGVFPDRDDLPVCGGDAAE